ncbi:uncharacterized protein [Mycetomoellerius zeteki]|uniref:uncharacterized protein n=1 Tax=Mycetomoellerius zeteki TaxID=64791 RepID=UPI00084EAADE|nr:PREDICTED: uncharacterized protein LOC108723958 [Trachymyrmex zeteki]
MILNRLYWLIESPLSDLLPNNQFGFRKFRSCQDNLTVLVASIHSGFISKQDTVALFIDIKSAFDNVLPHILIQDLQKLEFPPLTLSFINNLISYHTIQFINQDSISESRASFKGTPQLGSVLSPTLFNLYLRMINDTLHPDTELLQFADDIVIFSSLKDTALAVHSVERSLYGLEDFLRNRGLEISLPKTQLMIFSNKRSPDPMSWSILFQGHLISPSSTVRFLGVLLDSKLTGKAHMFYVINKGKRILQIISAFRGTWWGAHPHMLLTIYRAMLRASIEYSAQIFGTNNDSRLHLLQVIQNQAIRLCFGYRISTPLNVVFTESVELTLPFRFRLLTSRYFIKISSVRDHPAVIKLHFLCDLARAPSDWTTYARISQPLLSFSASGRITPLWTAHLPYPTIDILFPLHPSLPLTSRSLLPPPLLSSDLPDSMPTINAQPLFTLFDQELACLTAESTTFFTDGSKVDHGTCVGAAVFSPQLQAELMFKLSSYTSIFSAEAYAIYTVITLLVDLHLPRVTVITDSKSVLESIRGSHNYTNNYLIPLIKSVLEEAETKGTSIQFIWVPSHRGIEGNERADQLAKRAIRQGIEPNFKVPYSDLSAVIKQQTLDNFYLYLESMADI